MQIDADAACSQAAARVHLIGKTTYAQGRPAYLWTAQHDLNQCRHPTWETGVGKLQLPASQRQCWRPSLFCGHVYQKSSNIRNSSTYDTERLSLTRSPDQSPRRTEYSIRCASAWCTTSFTR